MYDFIKLLMVGTIGLLLVNVLCVLSGAVALVYIQISGAFSNETTLVVIGFMAVNAICGIAIFAFLKRIWRIG